MIVAVADMNIFDELTPEYVFSLDLSAAKIVVVDGNLPTVTLAAIAQRSSEWPLGGATVSD